MQTNHRPESTQGAVGSSFPQRKAFVLHFSADAGPQTGLFRGRVEHVTSGDQARFGSTEELWSFVREVLLRPEEVPTALPPARPRLVLAALPASLAARRAETEAPREAAVG